MIWLVVIGLITICCHWIKHTEGVTHRFSHEIMTLMESSNDKNPRIDECLLPINGSNIKSCRYGQGPLALIVIGDSHADAMMNGIVAALPKGTSLLAYTISGCPTVKFLKMSNSQKYQCGERISKIITELKHYPQNIPVLVVNRANAIFKGQPENDPSGSPIRYVNYPHSNFDQNYFKEMENAYIATLKELHDFHPVFVTRPTPEAPLNVVNLASRVKFYDLDDRQLEISREDYMKRSEMTWHAQDKAAQRFGIHIIDLSQFFCDQDSCRLTDHGVPLFRDDDHMSWSASKHLSPLFKKVLFSTY